MLKKLGLPMTHYDSYLSDVVAPWQLELPSPEKMFYSKKVRTITDESLKAQEYNISSPDPGIRVFVLNTELVSRISTRAQLRKLSFSLTK